MGEVWEGDPAGYILTRMSISTISVKADIHSLCVCSARRGEWVVCVHSFFSPKNNSTVEILAGFSLCWGENSGWRAEVSPNKGWTPGSVTPSRIFETIIRIYLGQWEHQAS